MYAELHMTSTRFRSSLIGLLIYLYRSETVLEGNLAFFLIWYSQENQSLEKDHQQK